MNCLCVCLSVLQNDPRVDLSCLSKVNAPFIILRLVNMVTVSWDTSAEKVKLLALVQLALSLFLQDASGTVAVLGILAVTIAANSTDLLHLFLVLNLISVISNLLSLFTHHGWWGWGVLVLHIVIKAAGAYYAYDLTSSTAAGDEKTLKEVISCPHLSLACVTSTTTARTRLTHHGPCSTAEGPVQEYQPFGGSQTRRADPFASRYNPPVTLPPQPAASYVPPPVPLPTVSPAPPQTLPTQGPAAQDLL